MRRANSLVAMGEIELMSTTTLPADNPSATPAAPNSTASTSGVSGSMAMITSALWATSRDEPQALAPAAINSWGTPLRLCR